MPSAERRRYMTRAEVTKSLKTSDVVPFSGKGKDEDAEDFLQCLDEVVIDDPLADVEISCAFRRYCAGARAIGGASIATI